MVRWNDLKKKQRARINDALCAAGWAVQNRHETNVRVARERAIREFPLRRGHGFADYLLYVYGPAGIIKAIKEGKTLTGVEIEAEKYSVGLPDQIPALVQPLPFLYQSTGVGMRFTNRLES